MLLRLTTNILLCVLLVIFPTAPATNHLEDPPKLVYLPLVGRSFYTGDPPLLISALYYDTYISSEPDEAFQVYNPLPTAVSLAGWQVTAGTRTVTFPAGMTLSGNAKLWCARKAIELSPDLRCVAGLRIRRRYRSGRAGFDRRRAHAHQHGRAGDADQSERQLYRRAGLRSRRHQRPRLAGPGGLSVQTLHQPSARRARSSTASSTSAPGCPCPTPTRAPTGRRIRMISSTAARRSIPAGSWIASSCRASSRSRQP